MTEPIPALVSRHRLTPLHAEQHQDCIEGLLVRMRLLAGGQQLTSELRIRIDVMDKYVRNWRDHNTSYLDPGGIEVLFGRWAVEAMVKEGST